MFLWLGNVVAWLALIFGALRIVAGVVVASNPDTPELAARYLGSSTYGEAIDQGTIVVLFAIMLGTLVKIGRSLQRRRN